MNRGQIYKPEKRERIFLAAEGKGEQSLSKWAQGLSDGKQLSIYLDCKVLGGGGYRSMLKQAIKLRQKGLKKGYYSHSFLLVDSDRADRGDCSGDWTLEQLRGAAAKHGIEVCVQKPNLEGLMLAMLLSDKKHPYPVSTSAAAVKRRLQEAWPEYEKSVDAFTLSQKFSINDLARVARQDVDLKNFLTTIGLISD